MAYSSIPTVCINLERRPDRRQSAVALKRQLQFPNYKLLKATDGQALQRQGGRHKFLRANRYRMCWDADDGARVVHECWGGSGAEKGTADLWSLLGCTLSHKEALHYLQNVLRHTGLDCALVLEDDSVLRPDLTGQAFHATLIRILETMSARFPRWGLLQLCGAPVGSWAPKTRHKRCGVTGVRVGECVYLANAYIVRAHAIDEIVARLSKGMTADGAIVSYQRAGNRQGPPKAFWCEPPLIIQEKSFMSDIARIPGTASAPDRTQWKRILAMGRANKKRLQAIRKRDGVAGKKQMRLRPIKRTNIKNMRRQMASRGGSRNAGSGSNAKVIAKKKRWLLKQKAKLGEWPSWKSSWTSASISYNLYCRLVKEM